MQAIWWWPDALRQHLQGIGLLPADEQHGPHIEPLKLGGWVSQSAHAFPLGLVIKHQKSIPVVGHDLVAQRRTIEVFIADALALVVGQHPLDQYIGGT